MKFHWTIEPFGFALRDINNNARGAVTSPGTGQGFYGCIFERGLPDSGPYKGRREAAAWIERILVQREIVPADSQFSALPGVPQREAA